MANQRQMLLEVETGNLRLAAPTPPLLTSAPGPWSGILLEEHYFEGPQEGRNLAPPEHVVILQLERSVEFEWQQDHGWVHMSLHPGQFLLFPAMAPYSYRSRDLGRFLALSLEPAFVQCAAHDLFSGPEGWNWSEPAPTTDPLVYSLGISLRQEALAGFAGGRTYGESLATALAVQLVRRYGNARSANPGDGSRLNRTQLRRTIDFIQDHLAGEVSLAALAQRAGLSPFHFARLFKATTGQAPHQYVLRCRVERARQLLLSGSQTAADIAIQVGFCDQSHLTTHFKRIYGLTPRVFRLRMGQRKILT